MSVQDKISKKFRGIQGGLFEKVSKADVGTALNDLIANGAALMCWADPFYPDPAIPEHVKRATLAGLEDGTSAHYTMPIGNMELKTGEKAQGIQPPGCGPGAQHNYYTRFRCRPDVCNDALH